MLENDPISRKIDTLRLLCGLAVLCHGDFIRRVGRAYRMSALERPDFCTSDAVGTSALDRRAGLAGISALRPRTRGILCGPRFFWFVRGNRNARPFTDRRMVVCERERGSFKSSNLYDLRGFEILARIHAQNFQEKEIQMLVELESGVVLDPCPFCGSKALLKCDGWPSSVFPNNDPKYAYYWVKCQNPKCGVSPAATSSATSAVSAWNNRE